MNRQILMGQGLNKMKLGTCQSKLGNIYTKSNRLTYWEWPENWQLERRPNNNIWNIDHFHEALRGLEKGQFRLRNSFSILCSTDYTQVKSQLFDIEKKILKEPIDLKPTITCNKATENLPCLDMIYFSYASRIITEVNDYGQKWYISGMQAKCKDGRRMFHSMYWERKDNGGLVIPHTGLRYFQGWNPTKYYSISKSR